MELIEDVAAERLALADDLCGLSDDQWRQPSLCEGWTVKATAAHLTMPFHYSLLRMAGLAIRHRGFDKASRHIAINDAARRSTQDIVEDLRANARHGFTPPGMGFEAPLTDLVIHGQDIRRPLGLIRSTPESSLRCALDLLVSPKGRFAKPRRGIYGIRFEAEDIDWSSGQGLLVSGAADALALAIAGRTATLDELTGAGVEELRLRY